MAPGKRQQNAFVERFNRRLRHEYLDEAPVHNFDHICSALHTWEDAFNHVHPHEALKGLTAARAAERAHATTDYLHSRGVLNAIATYLPARYGCPHLKGGLACTVSGVGLLPFWLRQRYLAAALARP